MKTVNPTPRPESDRFLVAFSFAGEQRELVRQIAEETEQRLGWGTVFFDEWFEGQLAGTARDLKLQQIYRTCEVIVVCASADYGGKKWPIVEWDSIRERHSNLRAARNNESDRLFPLRVAEGEVEGLLDNAIWIDARQRTPGHIAELIFGRVRKFVPEAGKLCVFLAETSRDLDDESQPVNRARLRRFIEAECHCVVAPAHDLLDLDIDDYQRELEAELARSQAFVQLLSETPWRPGNYDRRQFQASAECHLPQFCFLGDTVVETVKNEGQQEFLLNCKRKGKIIAGQFEDFKQHLREKLGELAAMRRTAVRELQNPKPPVSDEARPLIRVAVFAENERDLFSPVKKFLHEQNHAIIDHIYDIESLKTTHINDPCHGFVILCDSTVLSNKGCFQQKALNQCRMIQDDQKHEELPMSPVAVVFRTPPAPDWDALIQSTPRRYVQVELPNLEHDLQDFLKEAELVQRAYEERRALK